MGSPFPSSTLILTASSVDEVDETEVVYGGNVMCVRNHVREERLDGDDDKD